LFAEAAPGLTAGEIETGRRAPPAGGVPVREVTASQGAVLLPFETTLAALQAAQRFTAGGSEPRRG